MSSFSTPLLVHSCKPHFSMENVAWGRLWTYASFGAKERKLDLKSQGLAQMSWRRCPVSSPLPMAPLCWVGCSNNASLTVSWASQLMGNFLTEALPPLPSVLLSHKHPACPLESTKICHDIFVYGSHTLSSTRMASCLCCPSLYIPDLDVTFGTRTLVTAQPRQPYCL